MARRAQRTAGNLLSLALWCIVLVPLAIMLHELAHWAVARAAGFPAQLHYGSVSGYPVEAPFSGAPGAVALASLAGPAMSLLLLGFGAANRRSIWGAPLVAAAISRFAVNLGYVVLQLLAVAGVVTVSDGVFDEMVASKALGLPPLLLTSIGALALVAAIAWLWRHAGGSGFLALAVGTAAGMFGWMAVLGPRVLP